MDSKDISTQVDSSQVDINTSKSDTKILEKQMDKPSPVTRIKKQKLREEIMIMIRELKDISMYSDELMSKSRKKKHIQTNECSNSSVNKMSYEKVILKVLPITTYYLDFIM